MELYRTDINIYIFVSLEDNVIHAYLGNDIVDKIKFSLSLIKHYTMKAYGGVDV
jgi:hypothetical protein